MTEPQDERALVTRLLAMSGLTASGDDLDALVAGYATSRQLVATLHALPAVRHEEPAPLFDARTASDATGSGGPDATR